MAVVRTLWRHPIDGDVLLPQPDLLDVILSRAHFADVQFLFEHQATLDHQNLLDHRNDDLVGGLANPGLALNWFANRYTANFYGLDSQWNLDLFQPLGGGAPDANTSGFHHPLSDVEGLRGQPDYRFVALFFALSCS